MSFEAREHCARFPFWEVLSWEERLAFARDPSSCCFSVTELTERRSRREDEKSMNAIEASVNSLELSSGVESLLKSPCALPHAVARTYCSAEKLETAEAVERQNSLQHIPEAITWLGMRVKLARFLLEGGIHEDDRAAQNEAQSRMRACAESGRSSLRLRS